MRFWELIRQDRVAQAKEAALFAQDERNAREAVRQARQKALSNGEVEKLLYPHLSTERRRFPDG